MNEQAQYERAAAAARAAAEQMAALEATAAELRKRAAGVAETEQAAMAAAVSELVAAGGAGSLPGGRLAGLQADRAVVAAALVECDVQLAAARRAAGMAAADAMDAEAAVCAAESAALAEQVSAALAQVGALSGSEYLPRGGNSRADELDARSRTLRRDANALRRSHVVK